MLLPGGDRYEWLEESEPPEGFYLVGSTYMGPRILDQWTPMLVRMPWFRGAHVFWCKYIAEMKVTKWKSVHRELGLKASVDHHWITVHHYSNWNYLVVSNENKERAWQLNSLFVCSCSFPSSICSVYQLAWVLVLPILGLPKMLPDWHNLLQCWKLLNYWISAVLFFCKHITFGFVNTYPFSVPEEQWYSALNEQWYIPNF